VSVQYTTADASATTANNDYVANAGTLVFAPGETTQTITVIGLGDITAEETETFSVQLTNPTNSGISDGIGAGTLLNDDRVRFSDFNRDGQEDIVWRNQITGENMIWLMNSTLHVGTLALPTVNSDWTLECVGDFNRDNNSDLLWRNYQTGQTVIWMMNGATIGEFVSLVDTNGSWKVEGAADFDGDGNLDILWRNRFTGENVIWFMDGATISAFESLSLVNTNWSIEGVGDYNGDGSPDIIWRDYQTGTVVVWQTFNAGTTIFYGAETLFTVPDLNSHITKVADFNQNGTLDFAWRNYATGYNSIWLMNDANVIANVELNVMDTSWEMV
jgi:hypothetical protein